MNDGKPEWYNRLNTNERRIVNLIMVSSRNCFVSRPVLEHQLCKTRLMNQRTLTSRLHYLVDRGILGKVVGKKGAVFYAPSVLVKQVQENPMAKSLVYGAIDASSPREGFGIPLPARVKLERVSDEEMWAGLVRAGETWERVGVGIPKEKERVYQNLRKARRELVRKRELRTL